MSGCQTCGRRCKGRYCRACELDEHWGGPIDETDAFDAPEEDDA